MPNNYVLLETIALTQNAASVTFDNLPTSGYTDLKIVFSARVDSTNDLFILGFNGSTTGYSNQWIYGNGSSASANSSGSYTQLISWVNTSDNTASTYGNAEIYIANYRSTTNYKTYSADFVTENNATGAESGFMASLWSNNAAITSIKLESIIGANILAGSTFSLYGVAAYGTTPVTAPKATGGNIVANDGTYWYHAFTSSGYFVPQVGLTADVLVVAGGGGGGYDLGGGGGAGGVIAFSAQSLTSGTNFAALVGAGGPGGTTAKGTNGVNSQFSSLTAAVGGGGGGGSSSRTGSNGGSGGGGTRYNGNLGGSPTTGQGFAGGNGPTGSSSEYAGAGGGGAGAVGNNATATAGAGGAGTNSVTNWGALSGALTATNLGVSGYIAGGGGGGQFASNTDGGNGGSGGGGNGSRDSSSTFNRDKTPGTASTGSGGGGGSNLDANWMIGGAGGSGVIIVRYPIN